MTIPDGSQDPRGSYIQREIRRNLRKIPPLYWNAEANHPEIIAWCDEVIAAYATIGGVPMPPPLLLLGPTGVGKTWQAYGAVQRISENGLRLGTGILIPWIAVNVPDLLARLRPSATPDPEGEFDQFASVPLLFLDDIAAQRDTDWSDEILYRLLDRRRSWLRPSIYVTNLPWSDDDPGQATIQSVIADQRITSRLAGCRWVTLKGEDRRYGEGGN